MSQDKNIFSAFLDGVHKTVDGTLNAIAGNFNANKKTVDKDDAGTILAPTTEVDEKLLNALSGGRKLVVCVDGTWQAPGTMADATSKGGIVQTPVIVPSNIVKLAYMLGASDYPSHPGQLVYYHAGVATETDVEDKAKSDLQGMFGNIDDYILDIYAWLSKSYQPGDEIYAFGFSRGATIVRSLFSLIRYIGLVKYESWGLKAKEEFLKDINDAYNIYKLRDDDPENFKSKAEDFKAKESHDSVCLRFIGVFDTVQALGIPPSYTGEKLLNVFAQAAGKIEKNDFHDLRIGAEVQEAYHAIALDECREYFPPTLFEKSDVASGKREQVWFRGAHADVGGGFFEEGLSDVSLGWMVEKAKGAGLLILHDIKTFEKAQRVFLMGISEEEWKRRELKVIHDGFEKYPNGNSPYGNKIPRDFSFYKVSEEGSHSYFHESVFNLKIKAPENLRTHLKEKLPHLFEKLEKLHLDK